MADERRNKKGNAEATLNIPRGKRAPQAAELEEMVLGAIMIEEEAYSKVNDILKVEYFYVPAHRKVYTAIAELDSHQEPIDMFTVSEQLKKKGELDDLHGIDESVSGYAFIASLTDKVGSSAHLEYHAKIIAQKYISRELIRISGNISTESFDEELDVQQVLEHAENELFQLSQQHVSSDFKQIDSVVEEARERISKAASNKDGMIGVPSGFNELDNLTKGWQRSDLIIVAARPAMGKTAFVLSMAKNIAVDRRLPVAMFSLEMSNVQLVNRLIINVSGIPGEKIKTGDLSPQEWEHLDAKLKELYGAPMYVDDTPALSIGAFQSKARRLVKNHDVRLIIIDYLQLMNNSTNKNQSRENEIASISRALKGLAKELDIPIIALSQLNRNVESRDKDAKKPQLSDLRESGAIEQDADMVIFIHRPEYYKIYELDGRDMHGIAQILVAKHRNGATKDIDLRFMNEYIRFANLNDDVYTAPTPKSFVGGGQFLESKTNRGSVNDSSSLYTPPPMDPSSPF